MRGEDQQQDHMFSYLSETLASASPTELRRHAQLEPIHLGAHRFGVIRPKVNILAAVNQREG